MNDLRLSIHQTYAQLGLKTNLATLDIQQPLGEQSIQQPNAKLDIHQPQGELSIDSTDAWIALGSGPHLQWMQSIYSQYPEISLQAIAKTVEDGNRMAQITNPEDAFADIASTIFPTSTPIQYIGEASTLNVKMSYTAKKPIIGVEEQKPIISYIPRKPEMQYNRGKVDMYLKHRNTLDIQVTTYDLYK